MEKNKVDIEMADMVGKTYFKVATWYNQDFGTEKERQESLKHVCVEVIQQILEDTFLQLEGVAETGVKTVSSESKIVSETNQKPQGGMFVVEEDPITKALRENK